MFSTIVHPTDLSEAALPALKAAHDLAKLTKAKLVVCYVAHPPLMASNNELIDPETNEKRNIEVEVKEAQPMEAGVDCDVRILMTEHSSGVKSLLDFFEKMSCDLLVVGMHKRSGISAWLSGSITEEVVRKAKCNVLVAK